LLMRTYSKETVQRDFPDAERRHSIQSRDRPPSPCHSRGGPLR
jgi:hypothetical protein